jgi:short-chain fatty acids transporter
MNTDISQRTLSKTSPLGKLTSFFAYIFERIMPDPFVFAVILTILVGLLAKGLAPANSIDLIAVSWYNGIFSIFAFGFQMVLIVVTGYALASSPFVHSILEKAASYPQTPRSAVALTVLVGMFASWLNWGFGLVTTALFAREIAKRVRLDFGWLVAAAYTGFVTSTEGISGSIALSQATPGSVLNLVEKSTGHSLFLSSTVFARFTIIPEIVLLIALPLIFRNLEPPADQSTFVDPEKLRSEDQRKIVKETRKSFGSTLENAWILNILLAACGFLALALQWRAKGFSLDLNSMILICLLLGLICHWRPVAYVDAVKNAARVSGAMILQYPLYGGIMGIMTASGLAGVISKSFLTLSTKHTLPFWTYVASVVIAFFIPSGGGHWAVQGPFVLPAAKDLHASMAGTTMAVAIGESVANMIQPFYTLPLLAIAGIPMRRIMGFMAITFIVSFVVFGLSLLVFLPS